jgi:thymidine kinase
VSSGKEAFKIALEADVVAVDEAFMIDGIADAVIDLFRMGKSVYVSSIQLSARGETFEEVQKMFPWATRIEVCPAVCSETGLDAYYTVAKVDGLNQIDVGGAEKYIPRCHALAPFMAK